MFIEVETLAVGGSTSSSAPRLQPKASCRSAAFDVVFSLDNVSSSRTAPSRLKAYRYVSARQMTKNDSEKRRNQSVGLGRRDASTAQLSNKQRLEFVLAKTGSMNPLEGLT